MRTIGRWQSDFWGQWEDGEVVRMFEAERPRDRCHSGAAGTDLGPAEGIR